MDKELLLQIAAGNEKAFAIFVRHHLRNIYGHCLSYLKSPQQAEELTQDIFLQLWKQRATLPTLDNPEDYIYILSRNHIFRSYRKKVMELAELPDNFDQAAPELADELAEYKDAYALLMRGIDQLPEKRRAVFIMSRIEGLSHAEIAERTGLHKVTVAQYIMLALDFLKKYLQENNGESIGVILLLLQIFS
ncbi:MAG: sigma-70 family RNA polymerase sigma factor [Candidatus Pseudobacter hemicellulosilyticus]|uniref:Sigma-70 family RNA polymerase sigma factor n=1 Tax=Candidatus Pseudobacter hemicellulosilyticus TaxID=3121375 RepID=A0AAJ6BH85_9BACT|nr:MAG: sigma-70 family RNA polymerase sigma factor [Pseudobacter sp.]